MEDDETLFERGLKMRFGDFIGGLRPSFQRDCYHIQVRHLRAIYICSLGILGQVRFGSSASLSSGKGPAPESTM